MGEAEHDSADEKRPSGSYDIAIAAGSVVGLAEAAARSTTAPQSWARLWERMTVEDRRTATLEYLRDVEKHPPAAAAAIHFLAAEMKTRVATVRRWPIEQRAARLAGVRGLAPEHISQFLTIFHRRRRGPMLARFLSVAGIPHEDGLVNPRGGEAVPVERLALAVQTIEREFPADEVSLYLDALELQRATPWRALREARRGFAAPPSQDSESDDTEHTKDQQGGES